MRSSPLDRLYMDAAYSLAERGLFSVTRNNPRVGCLIVKKGQTLGRGWHEKDGDEHAEVKALQDAGERAQGATVYVSLEPCCIEGRTGACTEVLAKHGIKRVVIGATDHHPQVRGRGVERLKELGLNVKLMGTPTENELNIGCRYRHRRHRPFVRVKVAMSIDGRTALADGESHWITGESARKDVQYWRGRSGAILTGIGTVLKDDPRLTVRESAYRGCDPWRVILDTHLRMPASSKMLSESGRTIVVCGSDAAEKPSSSMDIWRQDTPEVSLSSVLSRLGSEGVNELLVEAGSTLSGSFLASHLWDELIVYIAPKLMGQDAKPLAKIDVASMSETFNATVTSITEVGEDIRVILKPRVDQG